MENIILVQLSVYRAVTRARNFNHYATNNTLVTAEACFRAAIRLPLETQCSSAKNDTRNPSGGVLRKTGKIQ